jgi:tripartite ATP-independent transporter DctM subunit
MFETALLYAGVLIGLFLFGIPVGYAIALAALIFFHVSMGGTGDPAILLQRMFYGVDSFPLLAVPLFILAGNLMNTGGITHRIFRFADDLVGHFRLGLAQVNVFASMIFSGMSGSATVDCSAIGQIEMKAMLDAKYDRDYSAAVTAASSTVGPIVPPSIPLVIYGIVAQVSIGRLLLGGMIPGIIIGLALMSLIAIQGRIKAWPRGKFAGFGAVWRSFKAGFLPLLTPVILLGGILSGIFTPTEAAVVAAAYAAVLSLIVYREMGLKEFFHLCRNTMRWTAEIMIIIAAANALAYMIVYDQIPQNLVNTMSALQLDKWVILLLINLVLIAIGCFMETVAAITIAVPVLMPLIAHYGIDPVHFGLIVVMNLVIGLLSPPVGMVLFVTSRIADISVARLFKAVLVFYIPLLFVLLLVTYIPELVTFLPNVLMGAPQ